jgi:hypothetical protein
MQPIQYTIRNIPSAVDQAVRKRAKQQGISFNQTVVDLLTLQIFGTTTPALHDRFDWLFAKNTLDEGFDATITELSQVDEALWH